MKERSASECAEMEPRAVAFFDSVDKLLASAIMRVVKGQLSDPNSPSTHAYSQPTAVI